MYSGINPLLILCVQENTRSRYGLHFVKDEERNEFVTNQEMVDITGLSKAEVLAALFNASAPAGMGFLQAGNGPRVMTVEYAQDLVALGNEATPDYGGANLPGRPELYFDYLYGRPLKLDLTSDTEFNPWGFDRDNGGPGSAQRVIDKLRESRDVNNEQISESHDTQLADKLEPAMQMALGSPDIGGALLLAVNQDMKRSEIESDGLPVAPIQVSRSARTFLDWVTAEALKHYEVDPDKSIAVFTTLVRRHPGTSWIATHPITPMLLGTAHSRSAMEQAMSGFSVR